MKSLGGERVSVGSDPEAVPSPGKSISSYIKSALSRRQPAGRFFFGRDFVGSSGQEIEILKRS